MYKNEVVAILKQLEGEWSTVRDDIRDMVIDIMENEDLDCYVEDCGEHVEIQFEDEEGRDKEVIVRYELVGSNTWTVTKVF